MNFVRLQAYSGRGCAPGICIDSHMLTVGGEPVGPHYHNGFTLRMVDATYLIAIDETGAVHPLQPLQMASDIAWPAWALS